MDTPAKDSPPSTFGITARAGLFLGAGACLGLALHWLLLPSQHGGWLGMYSTGKMAAILGAALVGAVLGWRSRRGASTGEHPERVTLMVAASLLLLAAHDVGGAHLEIGTDITVNLIGVDQKLHGLKEGWHTQLISTWTPTGPEWTEQAVTWYPAGPTWIIAGICQVTGWAPLAAARVLWPLCYLLNVWLLSLVLKPLAGPNSWLTGRGRRVLLAAAVLWWIAGCDPAMMISADMLALPLNLAVLLGCLRLRRGDGTTGLWVLTGLAGGAIYLLKYSQFIAAAALLGITALLVVCRQGNRRQMMGAAVGLGLLLAVPAGLTWMQGSHSAVQFTVKDTLAQSEYIRLRYGDNFASVSTPMFTVLGCAGGLGWNGLGYGEWPRLTQLLADAGAANALWDKLQWNRVCGWCLVFGVLLTPPVWRALRGPFATGKREWLLAGAGVLTVLVLAVVGWRKGYQWNAGLEGGGRLLLPLSAVAMGLLVATAVRSWAWALLLGVIYIFGPWADYAEDVWSTHADGAGRTSLAKWDVSPTEIAEWSRTAKSQGAATLLVLEDDLVEGQRFVASEQRMPTFGAVVPVCFVSAGQLQQLLQGTTPPNQKLAVVLTPSVRNAETRARILRRGIVEITP